MPTELRRPRTAHRQAEIVAAAVLARYQGRTLDACRYDLRAFFQWTQFEDFPRFLEGVESVTQLDDKRLHWVAEIAGTRREWDAEIVDQEPDQKITWRSLDGTPNAGTVTFQPEGAGTRVTLDLDVEPQGIVETIGDKLGFVSKNAEGDLKCFKEFIESRNSETGAWRGEV